MSKKFTKTILSSVVAGLLLASGGAMAQENIKIGDYTIEFYDNGGRAKIVHEPTERKNGGGLQVNTETGTVSLVNKKELSSAINDFYVAYPKLKNDEKGKLIVAQVAGDAARYSVDVPELKKENIRSITVAELNKIKETTETVSKNITTKTAAAYNTAIKNGVSVESALAAAKDGNPGLLNEFNRLGTNVNSLKETTTFALDENGEITDGQGVESVSVKSVVAGVKADTTIYQNKDGSYTLDQTAPGNVRVNEAIVSLDKSVRERTTVGVSSDGTLTRAEGAENTISVNDGLVALSGRTDRIDATVGAIDGRVTHNTQSIEKNSKAIAANTRTLQQHSARLDSQQRQINENHKEMKRAAAQSAALTGLFQPYSVGKFNATAAVGGYSDQQALAVGVGYRFNEQTAAKAGVAFSDGDASWNVGVNFEF
ncbi:hypothetical protein EHJ72_000543 [Escherichia coli]|nr:hypothetical protein [Escherichia coli]